MFLSMSFCCVASTCKMPIRKQKVSLGIPNETCWRVYCTEPAEVEHQNSFYEQVLNWSTARKLGGGLRNYYISDPVVGRVLLATMPGEIACPLDGEKEKDQIAPVLLRSVSKSC